MRDRLDLEPVTRFVAFLRGVNVGAAGRGRKSVPMADLRAQAEALGWSAVRTYIQSGNLVFDSRAKASALESVLESAISEHFGFDVPVIVRRASDLQRARAGCPFEPEALERPNLVHIGFAKSKWSPDLVASLEPYARHGERVALVGSALWTDFPNGVARSKITPAVFDRSAGSPVTLRNIKTLDAVLELCGS